MSGTASARVFNSSLKLKVYSRGEGDVPDQVLGFTPVRNGHRVHVPDDEIWYVRPSGPLGGGVLERLVRLARQEKIPGLDLSDHWDLTNEKLILLRPLKRLSMLDISRTKTSDAGLGALQSLSGLTVLILPDTISDNGIAKLIALQNLREINLDQSHLTDRGLKSLSTLPRLENLDLSSTRVTDAGLVVLPAMHHLRRLSLPASITDESASSLRGLTELREIDISQTQIGVRGLEALASLPKLQTIFLGKLVNDAGLKALSASPSLRALDLTRTAVTDDGVRTLGRVKTLEELALSQTSVGNACLPALAGLPVLRMLELSETRVTSRGLAPLAKLKKLEMLSLSWQKLSREDLQGMAKLKQLKTIVLNGVPLPESTMVQLRRLGSPSPWDSIDGIERARLIENRTTDQVVLSAPVPPPAAMSMTKELPNLPKPIPTQATYTSATPSAGGSKPAGVVATNKLVLKTPPKKLSSDLAPSVKDETKVASLPSHPESIAEMRPATPSADSPLAVTALTDAGRDNRAAKKLPGSKVESSAAPSDVTAASSPAAAKTAVSEENLLKVISLESNPSHAGGFSGLTGMRQLRHSSNMVAINTIAAGGKATIQEQEDKPENYLGELNATASH